MVVRMPEVPKPFTNRALRRAATHEPDAPLTRARPSRTS
jgi:hypothetical protein